MLTVLQFVAQVLFTNSHPTRYQTSWDVVRVYQQSPGVWATSTRTINR